MSSLAKLPTSNIVDDGNGTYVLPVSKTLKHELVDRINQTSAGPPLSESPYCSGQRYIPFAERRNRNIQQTKRKFKRHVYPNINVGDIVRVRGKLKEWSRRNGEVIREVVVDQDAGSIGKYN